MKIVLRGEPKSTSHIYKYHCRFGFPTGYMSKEGKDLKTDYQWQAKSQWRKGVIKDDIKIEIKLFFGTKRRQDFDNFLKIVMDSLTGIVWDDDSQIKDARIIINYDKQDPRIELEIL